MRRRGGGRIEGSRAAGAARRLAGRARARPGAAGGLALFALLLLAYGASIDIRASRGASITGDEPFYLLTTQSLLRDGNLDLRGQYAARSWESFFDHPAGLWSQSRPLPDGRLLSPHGPGLSVLLLPGFGLGGLAGAQFQLTAAAALTWALAYALALRLTGARPLLVWLATAAAALTATAFVYSSEVYPELPAALALVAALLAATGRGRLGAGRALAVAALLTALPWLGVKYAPLAAIAAAFALWRATPRARAAFAAAGALSAAAWAAFHLAAFDSLTPYHVNVVYAGDGTAEIVARHAGFGDRVYRLWGLLIDRRFGVGRWAPVLLAALPGLWLLARGDARLRLVLALVAAQALMASFVAITMMGWWFPGRTLAAVFPLLPIPLALAASAAGPYARASIAALGLYSLAVTAALAQAGHAREIAVAVDPFAMRAALFRVPGGLFPQYTAWTAETWLLTLAWLGLGGLAAAAWLAAGLRRARREGAREPPPDGPRPAAGSR